MIPGSEEGRGEDFKRGRENVPSFGFVKTLLNLMTGYLG